MTKIFDFNHYSETSITPLFGGERMILGKSVLGRIFKQLMPSISINTEYSPTYIISSDLK